MKVGALFRADDAVSPVIGIILMVAITVILAAITGAFVLSVGDEQQERPQATFEVEKIAEESTNPDEMRITHTGGDSIDNTILYIQIEGAQIQEWGGASTSDRLSWSQLGDGGDEVVAGDAVDFEPDNGNPDMEGRTVTLVWDPDVGTDAAIVFEYTVPG